MDGLVPIPVTCQNIKGFQNNSEIQHCQSNQNNFYKISNRFSPDVKTCQNQSIADRQILICCERGHIFLLSWLSKIAILICSKIASTTTDSG